jgi:undecaprenyl phosphate N,N'-diacetylbacillosamine 1-phosphate transferase
LYFKYLKRLFDLTFALILIIMLSPLLILIALALFFQNRESGFLFTQDRPGINEKIFKIFKFKTMNDEVDKQGVLLPDDVRLTKIGDFIRKTSLDEFPQLFNVLKGDMSLIGPRPLVPEYLSLYSKDQSRRHQVRPGITGWAQCNGRNAISWEEKFMLDVWYVDNISFLVDLRIILFTVRSVFYSQGIYRGSGISSMEAFNGKN